VPVAFAALAVPAPAVAPAGTKPVTAGVTVTPSSTEVGGQVAVVATATNNTSSTVAGSLGIQNPQYASERITRVSGHACTPRNLLRLIYCGNPQLAPGASMTITLSLRATAAGTDHFTIYAFITGASDVYAYGALSVSLSASTGKATATSGFFHVYGKYLTLAFNGKCTRWQKLPAGRAHRWYI
jgi:hypothetical protein